MKFSKHLQNVETPEWKRVYIDYRGLKKLMNAVQTSRKQLDVHSSGSAAVLAQNYSPIAEPGTSEADSYSNDHSLKWFELPPFNFSAVNLSIWPVHEPGLERTLPSSIPSADPNAQKTLMRTPSFDTNNSEQASSRLRRDYKEQCLITPSTELLSRELLTQFTPQDFAFFAMLDAQLDKVESFYLAREKEMVARGALLLNQLEELKEHRKIFLEAGTTKKHWATGFVSTLRSRIRPQMNPSKRDEEEMTLNIVGYSSSINSRSSESFSSSSFMAALMNWSGKRKDSEGSSWTSHSAQGHWEEGVWNSTKSERPHLTTRSDDPAGYIDAERKLRRAVLEHYRGLETLYNYSVLNIAGFRKAVKKFERSTKIPVQDRYMTENVGKCAFASAGTISDMIREMEYLYASAFVSGDKKKALNHLKASTSPSSHHGSTFRSGLLVGLALPALIDGLVKVLQPGTQQAMPYWDILLFLYGLIFVPVLYFLLLGANLSVWARSRINYIFIFDLDVSRHLNHRKYFEIPSLLLATLSFTFWFSFNRIGAPIIQPTTWPLVWLIFAVLLMVNPIPLMAKSSRYWLIKTILKLFLSGFRPVEFTDFWMGDQLCSFVFTLSNVSLIVCVYLHNFSDNWEKCRNSSQNWPIAFALACIPFIIRLAQCGKRYVDSKLTSHLINAGKYGTGVLNYLFYFMWCHQQYNRGTVFGVWVVVNTCYSIYACTWDILADYSFLQPHSKHLFLRTELMYTPQFVYYLAMLSNLVIRFLWIIYIPQRGPNMMVRTFITGIFEMLRRIQWNFYRLENEHVGNMDQYRVTRETPLPYAFDFPVREQDRDDNHTLASKR